ncbi:MAG TPA: cupin domain-containing protein [Planctomycetota bacterium]
MMPEGPEPAAVVVLACRDLPACLAFFGEIGFRLDTIFPADEPRSASLSGFGLRLCLERSEHDGGGHLRLPGVRPDATAPNGARIEFVGGPRETPAFPPATFAVSEPAADARWAEGRSGMLYRDLIPGRQGGALIASHIRIPRGGPVPDYVHHHRVTAQVIYCLRGSVRVVYEDQGEPFVMQAGDCVLQPPGIRHRVLESSDGLEVIEVTSPALHETCVDHELALPTNAHRPERQFAGQRFVRHEAARARWQAHAWQGWRACDTGIGSATAGACTVRMLRAEAGAQPVAFEHAASHVFWFVVRGALQFAHGAEAYVLRAGDACLLPSRAPITLREPAGDLELLEVALVNGQ